MQQQQKLYLNNDGFVFLFLLFTSTAFLRTTTCGPLRSYFNSLSGHTTLLASYFITAMLLHFKVLFPEKLLIRSWLHFNRQITHINSSPGMPFKVVMVA